MKKTSNIIAQEKIVSGQNFSDENTQPNESVTDQDKGFNTLGVTPFSERKLYYCTLTGYPIYL